MQVNILEQQPEYAAVKMSFDSEDEGRQWVKDNLNEGAVITLSDADSGIDVSGTYQETTGLVKWFIAGGRWIIMFILLFLVA